MVVVLNPDAPAAGSQGDNISVVLRKSMLILKGTFMAPDGSGVDYDKLEASSEWKDFVVALSALHFIKPTDFTNDKEKIAFFINMYNVLMIHGLLYKKYRTHPVIDGDKTFFDDVAYRIGNHEISLNAMEHGILRGNRPHPSDREATTFWKTDAEDDTQKKLTQWCVKEVDPRIHFALNCGARGCPRIQVYTSTNLEKGLALATTTFLENVPEPHSDEDKLTVSMLFKWYGSDFGATEADVAQWICSRAKHLQGKTCSGLEYEPYDWSMNKI